MAEPAYQVGDRVIMSRTRHRWDGQPEVGTVHERRQLRDGRWQYDIAIPGCCVWEFVYESQLQHDPLVVEFTAAIEGSTDGDDREADRD